MPVIVSTVVYLVLFTILVVEKYILIRMYPENTENYQDTLFMIIFILFGAMIFCGVCYKYFVASFIVFMLVIMTCMSTISHISDVISLGLVKFCCSWICGHPFGWCYRVFNQFTSPYRKQLSEIAMSGLSKSMK